MNRKAARALAKATLEGLELFDRVEDHEPDAFSGALIATVHSKSLGYVEDARDSFSSPAEIWVSIYVRRAANSGAATEDLLDDLVRAAMRAIAAAFSPSIEQLQIVSAAGYKDEGKHYRAERFAVQFTDDEE
jgi:hypothetical protein